MIISLIAAMDRNRVIGIKNGLPWHLPEDFKHFKSVTMGKPVIMGRKTYESIGRPLPGRRNIVVSTSGFSIEGVDTVSSLEEALVLVADVDEVMVIGGASIYAQTLPLANRLYITHVNTEVEGDAWFPEIDSNVWNMVEQQSFAADSKNPYDFTIRTYQRCN